VEAFMTIKRLIPCLTVLVAAVSWGCDTSSLQKRGVESIDSGTAGTGGSDACASGTAVAWQTPTVTLRACDFAIVADGKRYTSAGATVDVHSDPGDPVYTTLELIWTENDREMRYFIYFSADATGWWSNEMRTYNGQLPNSDWLYYEGTFFKSPLGGTFVGDVDLQNEALDPFRGELHLHGLQLSTTLTGG
jgi:hypothetical protein